MLNQELSGWYAVADEVAHSKLDVLAICRGEGDAPVFQKEISLIMENSWPMVYTATCACAMALLCAAATQGLQKPEA
jgi:hypothetical protein